MVALIVMSTLPWHSVDALARHQIRGRVVGVYRMSFVVLGALGESYVDDWTATPGCASRDCALSVRSRTPGARTDNWRLMLGYTGDLYKVVAR